MTFGSKMVAMVYVVLTNMGVSFLLGTPQNGGIPFGVPVKPQEKRQRDTVNKNTPVCSKQVEPPCKDGLEKLHASAERQVQNPAGPSR